VRPVRNRGRPLEPGLGACSIIEEADIVACVPEDKPEELKRLNPEARLGDHHCDPDIPGRSEFRGIIRQAIEGGQRGAAQCIGAIHQDELGLLLVQQSDGFRYLCLAILVQDVALGDEQYQVPFRNIFDCPRHNDLSRKLCN
jgi:hypothetical protein